MMPRIFVKDALKGVSVSLLIFGLSYGGYLGSFQPDKSLFSVVASISGAFAGFILVGLSIIYALPETAVYNKLKTFEPFREIPGIYYTTFIFLLVLMFLAVMGWFKFSENTLFVWTMLTMFIISIFFVYRCIWILKNIIEIRLKFE
ncbi:hypothetical protein [Thermococcus sp. 5-4]|uniref:hypothetical protein n=1 Tax=Thermococcus sp. 5-4 TaxID=2008440 RepID=UPI000B4A1EE3|nr:hypothetical protein [Thermococcus sp. 5-4]ASA77777.1 hypothetical protein CDI07_05535 [Thermococcus sp. 5-4]